MEILTLTSPVLETNGYLVAEGGEAMAVDAPYGAADWMMEEAEKRGWRIVRIVLTHAHWDHMVAAAELKRLSGAPLNVHRMDAPLAAHPVTLGMRLPFEIPPVAADRELSEGDEIAVGKARLKVLHTPGHSLGSICLHQPEEKVLMTGDTLFAGSCGRMDFPGGSEDEMRRSLKRLADLPPETRVYSGHGGATTIGEQDWMGSF